MVLIIATASVAISCLASACGTSRTSASDPKPSTPLYSEQAAALVAERLLAAVPLPQKAKRVPASPPSVAKELRRDRNSEDAPKSVDRYAYWISSERPERVLAFIAAHAPAELEGSGYGGTAGKTENWGETLGVPVASPLAGPRGLFVQAVLDGTRRYALRIDAVAAWHRRRPEDSLVPTSARWLQATIIEPAFRASNPGERSHARRTTHSYTATAVGTLLDAARAVNELPVAEPSGAFPGCPALSVANTYGAPSFRLTFRASARGGLLAVVIGQSGYVCDRGGAATAKITTPALPRGLLLTDHLNGVAVVNREGLSERLEAAFDHTLHLVPEG